MRSTTLILSTAIISSTLVGGAAAFAMPTQAQNATQTKSSNAKAESEHKYTICHATNSATNPYVMITVDYNSIVKKAGHDGHDGPVATSEEVAAELKSDKISWGDVIPAIAEHDYAGKNFTSEGILLLNNDCEMPNVTATEDPIEDEDEDTTGGNGNSTEEETETPGQGSVDSTDTETVVDTTDTTTDEPGKGGVATELPETGANWLAAAVAAVASMAAAGVAYGTQNVRRVAASLLKNQ